MKSKKLIATKRPAKLLLKQQFNFFFLAGICMSLFVMCLWHVCHLLDPILIILKGEGGQEPAGVTDVLGPCLHAFSCWLASGTLEKAAKCIDRQGSWYKQHQSKQGTAALMPFWQYVGNIYHGLHKYSPYLSKIYHMVQCYNLHLKCT